MQSFTLKRVKSLVLLMVLTLMIFAGNCMVVSAESIALGATDRGALRAILFTEGADVHKDMDYWFVSYETDSSTQSRIEAPFYLVTVLNDTGDNLEEVGTINKNLDTLSEYLSSEPNSDYRELAFNYQAFKHLSRGSQKTFIRQFSRAVRTSEMTDRGKQQIYNLLLTYDDSLINEAIPVMLESDLSPDVLEAMTFAEDLMLVTFFKLLLGFLVLILFIWCGVVTLLDLIFFLVPGWCSMIVNSYDNNNGKNMYKWLATPWAVKSYKASTTEETDRLAILIWLPKHFIVLLVVFLGIICLFNGYFGSILRGLSDLIRG